MQEMIPNAAGNLFQEGTVSDTIYVVQAFWRLALG